MIASTLGSSPAPALPYLELDHFVSGETQVHAVAALELEGTLVELGDGLIHVQHGILLHHFADDLRAAASPAWHGGSEPWGGQVRAPDPAGMELTRGGRVTPVAVHTSWTTEP